MDITQIKKRDGSIVNFEKAKIKLAMEKAATSINANTDLRPYDVIADHALRHIELEFDGTIPTVEAVQDLVERSLMEYGYYDVSKAYIIYRAERAKVRQAEKQEVVEKIETASLSYVDDNGTSKTLDKKRIKSFLQPAVVGFEDIVNLPDLIKQVEANLYEGINMTDLGRALVMAACSFIERDPAYTKVAARLVLDNLGQELFGHRSSSPAYEVSYRMSFGDTVRLCVETGRLVPELLEFDLEGLAAYLRPERDELLDYMGIQVLYDRYFLREEGGDKKLETTQTFWMRVAMGLAINEGAERNEYAKKFYDLLSNLRYVASTPTLFHSGTSFAQLSSCYLNTVDDALDQIFKVYGDNAQMSKYSGGIGTDWTNVRATGALVKSTNITSQGIIPFLKIANDVTVAINRSGKRRGAACVYLECWHMDYEDFLDLRRNTGDERRRAHDMNTASWIPDLFMKRVLEGGSWTFFSPDEVPELHHIYGKAFDSKYKEYELKAANGEIRLHKTIPAKDLWRKMISMLFETGHPWITWKDPSNVRSPQDHVGVIHNSNLCTEITLNNSSEETAVCNLGSINMGRHITNGRLDREKLQETATLAMRMLDNVVDLNFYPTPETRTSNMRHRPVGLGIMGFQDALYMLDIDFDSDLAVQFADESMELISYHAIMGSAMLAKEKGAYESFKGSKWDRGIFPVDTLDLLEKERGMPIGVSRKAELDWTPVRAAIKQYGIRNSNMMAVAPTATISNISGCYPCIEPIYKNLYVKSNMSGEFTVVNEYLVEDLKKLGLWNQTMLEELKRTDGSVQDITSIPPTLRAKYKTVFEVGASWLVKIAAYRGKWIDQSQSLNIFFQGGSGKALSDTYLQAWHFGLKTTYYLRTLGASSVEKSTLDLAKTVKAQVE